MTSDGGFLSKDLAQPIRFAFSVVPDSIRIP
jgi:hypothetical protein